MSHCVANHAVRSQSGGDYIRTVPTSDAQPIRVSNSELIGPTRTGSSNTNVNPIHDDSYTAGDPSDSARQASQGNITRFAQIRGEFMDSMTNAILRFLDKVRCHQYRFLFGEPHHPFTRLFRMTLLRTNTAVQTVVNTH